MAAMKITLAALLLLGAVLAAPPLCGYGPIVSYEHAVRRNFTYKNGKLLSTVLARQASARTEGCIEGWGITIVPDTDGVGVWRRAGTGGQEEPSDNTNAARATRTT